MVTGVLQHECVSLCASVCVSVRYRQARRLGDALLGLSVKQQRRWPEAEDSPRNIFVSFYAFSKETKEVVCLCVCMCVFIPFAG